MLQYRLVLQYREKGHFLCVGGAFLREITRKEMSVELLHRKVGSTI